MRNCADSGVELHLHSLIDRTQALGGQARRWARQVSFLAIGLERPNDDITESRNGLCEQLVNSLGQIPFRLILENGAKISSPDVSPLAKVSIRDHRTLAELIIDPEMAFGEAYAEGRIQVEGDLVGFLEAVYRSSTRAGASWYQRLTSKLMELWQANSIDGSRHNIHRHYDLGNDFYKLWLDPEMVYTCAYYPSSSATLEEAQAAKMDYICRKLQLQPGETVIEAGCGWGALALNMAQHYGASVKRSIYPVSRLPTPVGKLRRKD